MRLRHLYKAAGRPEELTAYARNLPPKSGDLLHEMQKLDDLAEVYLTAYYSLELENQYLYYYIPGHPRETWLSLDPSAYMWVDTNGVESILVSSQFLYAVADLINAILDISPADRTANMNDLITNYAPVIITDHYERWIYDDQGIFQVFNMFADGRLTDMQFI